jgi:structural maintenance of chromosome 1
MLNALESLKRLYPNVVRGRIIDLCTPVQSKYHVPLTVAMGKYMDAIVVETEKAAKDCIRYLKENRKGFATFIPLDTIRVRPLNERLRTIAGAKLAYDCMEFDHSIEKAVLHAVGNTMVVGNLEDAREVAFGPRGQGMRHRCVTLDGTLVERSGMITGGLSGVEAKAQRWDEKEVKTLNARKNKLMGELGGLSRRHRGSRREDIEADIRGTRTRVRQAQVDRKAVEKKASEAATAVTVIEAELQEMGPMLEKATKAVAKLEKSVATLRGRIDKVEDRVFANFTEAAGARMTTPL